MGEGRSAKLKRLWDRCWGWLTRNWVYGLSLIVIGGFIAGYVFVHYKLEAGDKYTVLVDLMLIVVALIGVTGLGIYHWLRRALDERTRRTAFLEGEAHSMRLHTRMGYCYWVMFRRLSDLEFLDAAIAETSDALYVHGHNLRERADEHDQEEMTGVAKNNLAYYLASRATVEGYR